MNMKRETLMAWTLLGALSVVGIPMTSCESWNENVNEEAEDVNEARRDAAENMDDTAKDAAEDVAEEEEELKDAINERPRNP
jgi:hypothetical protein